MKSVKFLSVLAVVAATATAAFAAPAVTEVETAKGKVLAGEKGMTLYTYKKDEKGVIELLRQMRHQLAALPRS